MAGIACLLVCLAAVRPAACRADEFVRAYYDAASDELVIAVRYRGTNRDHQFSLKWDRCQQQDDGSQTIVGELLDRQFDDPARKDFTKTLHFSIAGLTCRPATATIRSAPRFLLTLPIPAPPNPTNR